MEKNLKIMEMQNTKCRKLNMAKNTVKNEKNEKCTQQDLDYGEKTEKHGK